VARIQEAAPRATVYNGYGPTEATVNSAIYRIGHIGSEDAGWPVLPIGRRSADNALYILDRAGRLLPFGVRGELHVGGIGVARGYLNRPDLTAERFVPDPFTAVPGERLYRTGDLVRYLPSGDIEFLGRIDQQVKIRGFRIEPGEVEAVLGRHPGVREALVLVGEGLHGDKRLIGYVLPVGDEAPLAADLRDFLRGNLPEYMVPSAFVALPAWPLTPNGKIDRAALPAPDKAAATDRIAPRDTLEHEVARIWEEVLEVGPIGVRDDFFALGGHSLLAVRLMSKIEQQLGRTLPLTALFTAGTVEGMAALLRRDAAPESGGSHLIPLQPRGARPPFFWVHPAGGDVLCYALLARHMGSDQPLYGIQARGFAGGEEPLSSIEEMAAFYLDEIRRLQPEGPYHLGGWSLGGPVAFEMARQLRAAGEAVGLLAVLDGSPGANDEGGRPEENDVDYLLDIAASVGNFWGRPPEISPERPAALGPDEQVAYVAECLAAVEFLPPGTGERQLRQVLAVYRANVQALRAYQAGSYPDGMTLLRAEEPLPGVPAEDDLGWRRIAGGPVDIVTVPGNHLTLLTEPNVHVLAARLKLCLEKTQVGEMKTAR
jgi:thioesterase domain-containing protein/acyl carrier protein